MDEDDGEKYNQPKKAQVHKYDSGAADLQKVTDYEEEKEIPSQITQSAVTNILDTSKTKLNEPGEGTTIVIKKEDVELLINEMELTKCTAEKTLRKYQGDVKKALIAILTT
ncbi:Huntingtin-interacting protein K [Trichinella nativa]|uniref:Huntingtin-interacting protein K n=3 Tax=Trichinella TaxID=6333 RepID=A0A0V1LC85_9BILA|nr:Huntingtin-interacting protein K [Trichinella murrelli]KRX60863.1 Huntingtin-interacting protein K [Trichinella sp. T9]KRX77223.1 Huntingtin-interacting protein K [Trichinella sp. T6]KRY57034.1 Huntingtin-interacting protein K [Trichinella britovi]KRZ57167.1 Huntingtin-interacting protein K [Trichinella nativa]